MYGAIIVFGLQESQRFAASTNIIHGLQETDLLELRKWDDSVDEAHFESLLG